MAQPAVLGGVGCCSPAVFWIWIWFVGTSMALSTAADEFWPSLLGRQQAKDMAQHRRLRRVGSSRCVGDVTD